MKKILFLGAMAAMLLGTSSCSSDMEPAMGGETPVSFSINLGDDIDSRTISDGTGANTLKFAVFENNKEITALAQEVPVTNKKATVTTKLVKGHTYSFVFWAQNSECEAYNTADMSAIKVDYAANCNDESRDAFYKMDSFTVTKAFEREETLTRPFAQINFLASDAAGVVGVDAYKSKVTVTGVPTTLNTLDGTVGTETTNVTFDYATILPNEETLAGYQQYRYVAMNYILAGTNKEVKNEVVLTVNDGAQDVNTVTVANCPVQRNYRTNIFGDLFTLQGKFNITIDPIYNTPDYEVDLDATVFNVTTKEEFDAALASDAKKIVINLPEGEIAYKAQHSKHINYGGDNTESITIIGAGIDKTTIIGQSTYRAQISTKNPNCVVTLKNLTAKWVHVDNNGNENAYPATTWDAYDYQFKCHVNAENVNFLMPVAILGNDYVANFKNVNIDATNTPSEAYAMWICAGSNVTLENCTLNGVNADPSNGRKNRGIKISDEYSYNDGAVPTMAYLTVKNCVVKSDKKAAILVGNVAGATINVETIDITGVAADKDNAVHIDNGKNEKGLKYTDYKDLVTVTGANCIVEP